MQEKLEKFFNFQTNFQVDTAADDKPATSFDTASQTWKNMARVAVLCSRAEFASNDGNEGTMRREVIGMFLHSF